MSFSKKKKTNELRIQGTIGYDPQLPRNLFESLSSSRFVLFVFLGGEGGGGESYRLHFRSLFVHKFIWKVNVVF